jgi:hypothetical protein
VIEPLPKIAGEPGHHERGGRIEGNRLGSRRAFLATEDGAHPQQILGRVATSEGLGIAGLDAEITGFDTPLAHDLAVTHLDHGGRGADRDLVETVVGVDHERASRTELGEG